MASAPGEEARVLPWESKLALAIPLSPIVAGLTLSGCLVVLHIAVQAALGFPQRLPDDGGTAPLGPALRSGVVVSLLIGYVLSAGRVVMRLSAKELSHLEAPDVAGSDAEAARLAVPKSTLTRSRVAGVLGAAIALGLVISYVVRLPGFEPAWFRTWEFWASEWIWVWVYLPLLLWGVARGIWFSSVGTQEMTNVGARDLPIDLLDPTPREQFGRVALRNSLVWIVGLSLASLLFFDFGIGLTEILVLTPVLAIGTASFFVPVARVRRRIRETKRAELGRVDEELRVLRDRQAAGIAEPPGRLADRLAWRRHVLEVSDWPFDVPTLTRLGLYLLIPIGSWICGALVENLVDRLLD